MATFTHKVSWSWVVDGRVNTINYSYDITGVNRAMQWEGSADWGKIRAYATTSPIFAIAFGRTRTNFPTTVYVEDTTPTVYYTATLKNGEAQSIHLSQAGGHIDEGTSPSIFTLKDINFWGVTNYGDPVNAGQSISMAATLIFLHTATS